MSQTEGEVNRKKTPVRWTEPRSMTTEIAYQKSSGIFKIEEDASWALHLIAQWDSKTAYQTGLVRGDGDQVHCTQNTGRIFIEVGEDAEVRLDVISLDVEALGECQDAPVVVVTMAGAVSHSVLFEIQLGDCSKDNPYQLLKWIFYFQDHKRREIKLKMLTYKGGLWIIFGYNLTV